MSEKEFLIKPIFTARLSPEEQQMIQESIIDIVPEVDPSDLTTRKLLVRLVEIATTKVQKQKQSRPDDLETIEALTQESHKLSEIIQGQNEEIEELRKLNSEQAEIITHFEKQNGIFADTIEELSSKQLRPNELRIKLTPIQSALMDETCKRLSERLKNQVTPGPLLIDMFYRYTTKQETEIFYPFVLSRTDIKQIANQVRKQNQPSANVE